MKSNEKELKQLWNAFLDSPAPYKKTPAAKGKIPTEFRFKDPIRNFQCNIENCLQCCCRNQGQKIQLLLQDIAILLDHGHADKIEGRYGTKQEVGKFLKSLW